MSDSETDIPSATAISEGIRDTVIAIHKAGNTNDLTVKRVRDGVEKKLGLPSGYLKNDNWKDKSKNMIYEAVERYTGDEAEPSSPKKATKAKAKAKPEPKKKTKAATTSTPRAPKRKAAAPAKKPTKRRKTADSDEESEAALSDSPADDREPSDAESEPPKLPARRRKKLVAEESDEDETAPSTTLTKDIAKDGEDDEEMQDASSIKESERPATPIATVAKDEAESDMSDVLDESPAKSRRKSKTEKPAKAAKSVKAKPKPKAAKAKVEDTPDQAEIKRLQSWLVKCGIRKVWGKELQKCETPKDKIRHLKDMLKDAGMDGKYSVEKAAKIKEQREFAKDLEDIQAGAAAWGETSTGRPRRAAAARPVQPVTLPEDSDEEDGADGAEKPEDDDDSDDDDDEDVQGESGSDTGGSGGDDDGDDSDE